MKINKFIKKIIAIATRIAFFRVMLYPLRIIKLLVLWPISSREKQIISNLSNILIGDILVQVNEFRGKFYVSPDSALFGRLIIYNSYEPDLIEIVKQVLDPQKDIVDVGANIGFYTVLFQKMISKEKKVLAIEPSSKALKRLYQNLSINECTHNVIIFEGGVSNELGHMELKTINNREEYSTIGSVIHPAGNGQPFVTETVKISTVDLLVKEHCLAPGFIKIDVEGWEPQVLKGMQDTIQNHQPIILLEWDEFLLKSNNFNPQDTIHWLESYNYKIFDPIYPGFSPKNNMLCIPTKMVDKLFL